MSWLNAFLSFSVIYLKLRTALKLVWEADYEVKLLTVSLFVSGGCSGPSGGVVGGFW